jgi:hypothetical protein
MVLVFAIIGAVSIVLTLTSGFNFFISRLNEFGLKKAMTLGLVLIALADLGLFFIPSDINVSIFITLIFTLAAIRSFSANFYYTPANAVRFELIGLSQKPGYLSALVTNTGVFSGLVAVGVGLALSSEPSGFIYLFAISGASLFLSIIIMSNMVLPDISYTAKFPDYLKNISKKSFIAFTEFSHELQRTILPLVILFLFGTLTKSIWITALSSLGAILGVYGAGALKDRNNNILVIIAGLLVFISWFLYGFSIEPWHFVILGVLLGISTKVISTARDARFGREATNGVSAFEAIFSIEISKAISRLSILLFVLAVFIFSNTLPQILLVLGAFFMLPHIFYALGSIAKRKSVSM